MLVFPSLNWVNTTGVFNTWMPMCYLLSSTRVALRIFLSAITEKAETTSSFGYTPATI